MRTLSLSLNTSKIFLLCMCFIIKNVCTICLCVWINFTKRKISDKTFFVVLLSKKVNNFKNKKIVSFKTVILTRKKKENLLI